MAEPQQFEWDLEKARANERKHGIEFEEATTVFADPLALDWPDSLHSADESRSPLVGHSDRRRLIIVV